MNFTGSKTTGYVKTAEIENVESELDLATMMAISGAAASTGRPGISSTLELLDQLFPASSERSWHLPFVKRLSKYNVSRHEKTDR
jgi:hypothetical protein